MTLDRQRRWWSGVQRLNWPLLVVVAVLALLGIINLRSASMHSDVAFHLYHSVWLGAGSAMAVAMAFVDTRFFIRWAYALYGVAISLLALVALVGTELNASQRWLDLGIFMVQPSELLKLAVIVVTARFFHEQDRDESYGLHELWKPFALVGVGVLFVLNQPDLGTSLVILAIFMTMVLFEGVRWESLAALAVIVVVAIPFGYAFLLQDYQQDRVATYLNVDADTRGKSWQVRQSMIALGSGQLWGKGQLEGTQVQKGFVPEHENDFIAANWAEERGFAGMVLLLFVYLAFILCALNISRRADSRYGAVVAVGVAALFFWHIVVNLGMVTGVLPVVGLTLPMMSYGGSSMLVMLAGVGLLLNVSTSRRAF